MRFCSFCGSPLPDDAMFCGNCGRAVGSSTDTPVQPAENNNVNTANTVANPEQKSSGSGLSIAGFVLSIVSVISVMVDTVFTDLFLFAMDIDVFMAFDIFTVILAIPCIPGIICSAIAMGKKCSKRGLAIAGLIVGIAVAGYSLMTVALYVI